MILSAIKRKLSQSSTSKRERWLWFVGLYAVSVIAIVTVMFLLHGLVALLISI